MRKFLSIVVVLLSLFIISCSDNEQEKNKNAVYLRCFSDSVHVWRETETSFFSGCTNISDEPQGIYSHTIYAKGFGYGRASATGPVVHVVRASIAFDVYNTGNSQIFVEDRDFWWDFSGIFPNPELKTPNKQYVFIDSTGWAITNYTPSLFQEHVAWLQRDADAFLEYAYVTETFNDNYFRPMHFYIRSDTLFRSEFRIR